MSGAFTGYLMEKMESEMVSTDDLIEAAKMTANVYGSHALRHAKQERMKFVAEAIRREDLMKALAADVDLCEMLAGRIAQVKAGA